MLMFNFLTVLMGVAVWTPQAFGDTISMDGMWGYWSEYSDCSATCGCGTIYRTRLCDSPPPHGGGADCVGKNFEVKTCSRKPCPPPNPCKRNPCRNGGICSPTKWLGCDDSQPRFTCKCPNGYSGDTCQTADCSIFECRDSCKDPKIVFDNCLNCEVCLCNDCTVQTNVAMLML